MFEPGESAVKKEQKEVKKEELEPKTQKLFDVDVPSEFICRLTHTIMIDPVSTADGYTFERNAIAQHLVHSDINPITQDKLQHKMLTPNISLKRMIGKFVAEKQKELEKYLIVAIKAGKLEEVKTLLELGINANIVDEQGWTPMHHATKTGNAKMIGLLQEKGFALDTCSANYQADEKCLEPVNQNISRIEAQKKQKIKELQLQDEKSIEAETAETQQKLSELPQNEAKLVELKKQLEQLENRKSRKQYYSYQSGNYDRKEAERSKKSALESLRQYERYPQIINDDYSEKDQSRSGYYESSYFYNTYITYFGSYNDYLEYTRMQQALNSQIAELQTRISTLTRQNFPAQIDKLYKARQLYLQTIEIFPALVPFNHCEIKPLLEKSKTFSGIKTFLSKTRKGTSLHLAVCAGDRRTATFLLGLHANVNALDECGVPPILWAYVHNDKEMIALLKSNGAKISLNTKIGIGESYRLEEILEAFSYQDLIMQLKEEGEQEKIKANTAPLERTIATLQQTVVALQQALATSESKMTALAAGLEQKISELAESRRVQEKNPIKPRRARRTPPPPPPSEEPPSPLFLPSSSQSSASSIAHASQTFFAPPIMTPPPEPQTTTVAHPMPSIAIIPKADDTIRLVPSSSTSTATDCLEFRPH